MAYTLLGMRWGILGGPARLSSVKPLSMSPTSSHSPLLDMALMKLVLARPLRKRRTPSDVCCPFWSDSIRVPCEAVTYNRLDAAQCAIDWLDKKFLLPSYLREEAFPQGSLPAAGPLPILESQPQPIKRPSESTNGVPSPPPKRRTKGTNGTVDIEDENLPATQRVQALCHSMGMKAPRYDLTSADSRVNYLFNGYPDFGDDEHDFPEDLGRVTGIAGRENARQEIAVLVLTYLRNLYRERAAQHAELTGL